jgi:pyridoxal phosphate enzyme (YggS family)
MQFDKAGLEKVLTELKPYNAALVAVSKTKPATAIKEVYDEGLRDFGENYVQELTGKAEELPKDIHWHFIGHLQSNKVKMIAPFVSLIHGVDSFSLLKEINKQAFRNNRIIDCLLQIFIAEEETKFGLSIEESEAILSNPEFHTLENICVKGLMGMASLTSDRKKIKQEFHSLSLYFGKLQSRAFNKKHLNGHRPHFESGVNEIKTQAEIKNRVTAKASAQTNFNPEILSMGMSSDYRIALDEGSTMVRIGSLIFGER